MIRRTRIGILTANDTFCCFYFEFERKQRMPVSGGVHTVGLNVDKLRLTVEKQVSCDPSDWFNSIVEEEWYHRISDITIIMFHTVYILAHLQQKHVRENEFVPSF